MTGNDFIDFLLAANACIACLGFWTWLTLRAFKV